MKYLFYCLIWSLAALSTVSCTTKAERLSKYSGVTLERFYAISDLPQPKELVGLAVENKATKATKAIKGRLIINDLFDQEIRSIDLVLDMVIKPGDTEYKPVFIEHNPLDPKHALLNTKSISQVKAIWEPEKIIYLDGTMLE